MLRGGRATSGSANENGLDVADSRDLAKAFGPIGGNARIIVADAQVGGESQWSRGVLRQSARRLRSRAHVAVHVPTPSARQPSTRMARNGCRRQYLELRARHNDDNATIALASRNRRNHGQRVAGRRMRSP